MTASKSGYDSGKGLENHFSFSSQNSQKDDVTMRDGSVIMETT